VVKTDDTVDFSRGALHGLGDQADGLFRDKPHSLLDGMQHGQNCTRLVLQGVDKCRHTGGINLIRWGGWVHKAPGGWYGTIIL
jgi:hypothetical protein